MADERKKPAKSESLTIRVDPRTRFVLDFMSRIKGQTITTLVERAISESAEKVSIEKSDITYGWQDFWDISEGVRALNVAAERELYPSYEEEERLAFAKHHWEFFYATDRKSTVDRVYTDILWPRIDYFVNLYNETKSTDYFKAGKEMAEAIKSAGVAPPEWPRRKKDPPATATAARPAPVAKSKYDLDDDIPF